MSSTSWFNNKDNPALKPNTKPLIKPTTSIRSRPDPLKALLRMPTFNPISKQKALPTKIIKSVKQTTRKQVLTSAELLADVKVNLVHRSELSAEQLFILNAVLDGRNVFFTGFAGSGKSYLLTRIIKELKILNSVGVGVAASTGLAAHNIHGVSLHSLAGVGLGNQSVDQMVGICKRDKQVFTRWKKLKILVIDEVSMIHAAYFDKLEELARRIRGTLVKVFNF